MYWYHKTLVVALCDRKRRKVEEEEEKRIVELAVFHCLENIRAAVGDRTKLLYHAASTRTSLPAYRPSQIGPSRHKKRSNKPEQGAKYARV